MCITILVGHGITIILIQVVVFLPLQITQNIIDSTSRMLIYHYVTCSSEGSQPADTAVNKRLPHQQQIKQLQSQLEKARADLTAEKHAVALSNKEAAKLRILLKVRIYKPWMPKILV